MSLGVKTRTLELTSPAFGNGATIPARYTCEGSDTSPPLAWAGAPAGTGAFALIVDDPDAPAGTWVHWVAWDLPGDATELPAGIAPGAASPTQGVNSFGNRGYGGPCPPRGHGPHRYYFRLYALDRALGLRSTAGRAELDRAMHGRVLASAVWMGTFERKR